MTSSPLCKFKINANRRAKMHFEVFVWPTLKAMHGYCARHGVRKRPSYSGICVGYRTYFGEMQLGEIHFVKKRLGVEVMAHEATHAAMRYVFAKSLDISKVKFNNKSTILQVTSPEEYLCYAVGWMCRQMTTEFHKRGIWE